MPLPINAATVLIAAGYSTDGDLDNSDFVATHSDGVTTVEWNNTNVPSPPTEQQVTDWATDAVNLPAPENRPFSQWHDEHGGDATKTLRRKMKEILTAPGFNAAIRRAVLLVVLDNINELRTAASLSTLTRGQFFGQLVTKIDSGDADS